MGPEELERKLVSAFSHLMQGVEHFKTWGKESNPEMLMSFVYDALKAMDRRKVKRRKGDRE